MTETTGAESADAEVVDRVEVRGAYRTFERDTAPVRAPRGADLDVAWASSWPPWAPPAAGRARCST